MRISEAGSGDVHSVTPPLVNDWLPRVASCTSPDVSDTHEAWFPVAW